jgi:predicted ATP-dependent endonuclease of OLD family
MIIKSIRVENFRCIKGETLPCDELTVLVGANGSGKSAFLQALDKFYNPAARYDHEDFYGADTSRPILVTITYSDLTDREIESFRKYIEGGELVVQKEMSSAGGRAGQKYYGMSLQNPEFSAFREATSAVERRAAYRRVQAAGRFPSLPAYTNQDAARRALEDWEEAHPDKCKRQRDEGQFFGFREVGEARLEHYTGFLFIPAVLEASQEAAERKGSALDNLLDLVVRSVVARRENVREFVAETQERYEEVMDPSNLPELRTLESDLDRTLKTYAPGTAVELPWRAAEALDIPPPTAKPRLVEDEYATTVERAGHGLQRAFLLTLLQHLVVAEAPAEEASEGIAAEENSGSGQRATLTPDLILAIEEPELYQHPDRQRHLSRILLELATGRIEGVADRTQVMYTSHSPLLVDVDRTDHIRVLRKVVGDDGEPKQTKVSRTSIEDAMREIERACEKAEGTYSVDTFRSRLITLMTPWMNEGFFARVAVLVEGEQDRAAILGTARAKGDEFESMGISVIPCNGKTNLDRPTVIFRALGIRVYTLWDSDEGGTDPKTPEVNHRLLRLVGEEPEDWPDRVADTYACFKQKLETTLRSEIGPELFDTLVTKFRTEYGYDTKERALKSPMVIRRVIEEAGKQGKASGTLGEIVSRIGGLL